MFLVADKYHPACLIDEDMLTRNLVFQKPHDYVALGIYVAEFTFWLGIFACGVYYRLFPWLRSKTSTMGRIRPMITGSTTPASCTTSTVDGARPNMAGSRGAVQEVAMEQELEPRSMSVFRTASSRTSGSLRQRSNVFQFVGQAEEPV